MANLTNNTVSEYALEPAAGGVVIRTAQPGQSISIGANSGTGLAISNAELAQIFTTASGTITFGDPSQTGDIDVTGNVSSHPGFATLSLQTQNGKINEANGATITVANLALHAGTGIGTTGDFRTAVTNLAFANHSGAIHISNTGAVTLTNVDTLTGASIPGNIHSSSVVGSVYTLLHSSDGIKGQISYNGQPLAEGATLVLADGNRYQISYKANGGKDVTLTRIANVERAKVLDQTIRDGRAAALGFWADAAGLALIRRFNGGPTSQTLASWLAATLPNLYGAGAGTHDITGLTNAKVADLCATVPRPGVAAGGPGTGDGPGRLCHHPVPGRNRGTTGRLPGHGRRLGAIPTPSGPGRRPGRAQPDGPGRRPDPGGGEREGRRRRPGRRERDPAPSGR